MILGILGSIAGLSGYNPKRKQDIDSFPHFYQDISSIWISFHPIFSERPIFQKQMVTSNNYHGYGSDAGCFQITEQIIIAPTWKAYFYDETGQSKNIIENLRNKQTVFTPYLGKNEFRAEISNFEELENAVEITEEVKDKKSMKFDSVTLLKKPDKHPIIKNLSKGISFEKYFEAPKSQISDDGYSIFENYPYALGKDLHYKLALSVFTNWEIDPSTLMEGTRVFRIRDLEGKERTIQMFNGGLE